MKRFYKAVFSLVILFFMALVVMVLLSPYGEGNLYNHRYLESSIKIKESKKHAFSVLGNSNNARKWSVFVHHISTLNPNKTTDGSVGSIRRCYQNEDESGLQWDEKIIINEINKRRRLSIFNMVHFDMSADYLMTDQIYEDSKNGCKLTFTIFFDSTKEISLIDELKMYFAAYTAQRIFEKNLINIKHLIEEGDSYQRVHSFLNNN